MESNKLIGCLSCGRRGSFLGVGMDMTFASCSKEVAEAKFSVYDFREVCHSIKEKVS
jgi:hypothetical protein